MTLESNLHAELSDFSDEVVAVLEAGGFWDLPEGAYDPVEFYAGIPKKVKETYKKESAAKNSRVWDLVKAVLIGQAITTGVQQFKKSYPAKKITASPKDYADKYIKEHGGEFIKGMSRTDQNKLVGFIWSNAGQDERVLANMIQNQPHLRQMLDQGRHRTETIVRTEKFRATEYGTFRSAQNNKFTTKTRISAGDKRVRPAHRALNQITVGIDEPFPNGEYYPGENSINCRCRVRYGFDLNKIDKNAAKTYADNIAAYEKQAKAERAELSAARRVAPKMEPRKVAPKAEPRIIAPGIDQKYVDETLRNYHSMPDALKKNCKEIVLMPEASAKDAELSKQYGKSVHTEAAYDHAEKRIMGYPDNRGQQRAIAPDFMAHELAHAVDKGHSKSDLWHKATAKEGFSSQYATDFYYLNEKAKNALKEDFADSVKSYVTDRENFMQKFPSKYEYLEKNVFGGK